MLEKNKKCLSDCLTAVADIGEEGILFNGNMV